MADGRARTDGGARTSLKETVLLLVCVGLAAVIPLHNGWYRWPDAYIDFGREAYFAWRVLAGDVLQRDLGHLFGPLSTYFNAAMFALLGTSLGTLYLVNGILYFLLVLALFRVLRRFASLGAALLACTWVTAALAFNQLFAVGNYNFIAPYAHEVTHGLVLSAVALWLAIKMLERPTTRWPALAAGLAWGATALTKPEIFMALVAAVGLLLLLSRHELSARRLALFLVGGAALPAAFGLWFFARGGWRLCADNILLPFLALMGELRGDHVAGFPLYRYIMGTDNLGRRLGTVTFSAAALLAPLAAAWLAERFLAARIGARPLRALVRGCLGAVGLLAMYFAPMFMRLPAAVPLLLALVVASQLRTWRRQRSRETAIALATAALGGAILAKTLFNVRYEHYGFAIDFIAFAFLLAVAWDWARAYQMFLQPLLFGAALAVAIKLPTLSYDTFWREKNEVVAVGPDRLLTYTDDRSLADTVRMVAQRVPAQATLSVWPEGSIINYLARRKSSVPETVFLPFTLSLRGEQALLAELTASPPDFIILRNRDVREFGKTGFGVDYGESLFSWLEANYRVRDSYGVVPFYQQKTGMILYERAAR